MTGKECSKLASRAHKLQEMAATKARRLARARREPRYQAVVAAFVHARLLVSTTIQGQRGAVALKDVLWAGKVEPRLLELLPAVLIKKPSLVRVDKLPKDLAAVVGKLRRNEVPPDFRGIVGSKLAEWVPRIGHKAKLPTRLKAFRLRKDDVDLLQALAKARNLTETDVIRAGLRAL